MSQSDLKLGHVNYTFEPVFGYFAQDNSTDSGEIGPTPPRFGLLDESSHRWKIFFHAIEELNKEQKDVSFKLFMLGRHGEGWHNVAESFYGSEAWDDYWSKLDGDGNMTWGPDAEITDKGKEQAQLARELYNLEIDTYRFPIPQHFYTSPLSRALTTHDITFQDLESSHRKPTTLIVENCREVFGVHTCDKRRSLTYIHDNHPTLKPERGMTEDDEIWDPNVRESEEHLIQRGKDVLEMAFSQTKRHDTLISITAHSGFIRGIVKAAGRESYSLPTGGILPMLVKATGPISKCQFSYTRSVLIY